jgi:hypothetical protein
MTPDAVKYETVHHGDGHVTMPGLGVQTRTWVPDEGWPETDDRPIDWSKVFIWTPTSRLIRWMLSARNRALGLPLAIVLVPVYLLVASWAHGQPDSGAIGAAITLVGLWNAAKFAVSCLVITVLMLLHPKQRPPR